VATARKIHCEIFRKGERFGYRVRFHDAKTFHYVIGDFESLKWALEVHDPHNERIWEEPGPGDATDVVLKSDEYKPGSVGWQWSKRRSRDRVGVQPSGGARRLLKSTKERATPPDSGNGRGILRSGDAGWH
jgi:hypothetical protein